jgi:hypothetical protein
MDRIEQVEASFFDKSLIETDFFKRCRKGHYWYLENSSFMPHINYDFILSRLSDIHGLNPLHAKSYANRIKADHENFVACEAIISEVVVYAYYIPLKYEGIISGIDLDSKECDVIIEENDGGKRFYEILMIKPDLKINEVNEIRTHHQTGHASLRGKLLNKIKKQNQFRKDRKNIAAINLNDVGIVGDFHVVSSLSDGFKININRETGKISSGFMDWSRNFFDNSDTKNIYAIEWFDMGNYALRRTILNPYYGSGSEIDLDVAK